MARTTIPEVKQIVVTQLEDPDIQAYINVANRMTTKILGDDTVLTSTQLKDIEMFLTAHLITVTRERIATREKLGDAEITYAGTFGKYLDSTPYGQTVKILDVTGKMGAVGKQLAGLWAIETEDDD